MDSFTLSKSGYAGNEYHCTIWIGDLKLIEVASFTLISIRATHIENGRGGASAFEMVLEESPPSMSPCEQIQPRFHAIFAPEAAWLVDHADQIAATVDGRI